MTLSDQPVVQFAVLAVAGGALSVFTGLLVTDYRGFLTWYAHRCWEKFQIPSYRKALAWTSWQRQNYADEGQVRRLARAVSGLGLALGGILVVMEAAVAVSGHIG